MNISKEKKKEILLKNFDILKNNFGKNSSHYSDIISQMASIDVNTAIEMWVYLIKRYEDEVKSYHSYNITGSVAYDCEKILGEETVEKIILETPEIKNAYFSLMYRYVPQHCGRIIEKKISNNELMEANELLELVYNNPYKEDSWYKIIDNCMPLSDRWEPNENAIELLEMWCDKVEDEEERAKLSIKMLEYYKTDESEQNDDFSEALNDDDIDCSIEFLSSFEPTPNEELINLYPDTDENKEYMLDLLEEVDLYAQEKSPNVNRASSEIMESFHVLEDIGRLDVLSEILSRFAVVRDNLKPVKYSTLFSLGLRKMTDEGVLKIIMMNKPAFVAWLEEELVHEHSIIDIARRIGSICTKTEYYNFKNMVEKKFGNVRNLDYYFNSD